MPWHLGLTSASPSSFCQRRIANAWKRLELGTHTKYDLQLLKHEAAEAWYMRKHGPSYTNAHNAADKRYPAPNFDHNGVGNKPSNIPFE